MSNIVREFVEGQLIELVGWLSCDTRYDAEDDFAGWEVELYSDGRHLGDWRDVIGELQAFDGKRVRIVIEAVESDA